MAENQQETGLNKSLKLITVFAIATGAIFTFVAYWDTVFYSYCGPATFLAFALMTCAVIPIAFVYCDIAPFFPQAGAELIYNTVAYNKHVGFFSSWFIMMAWVAVPPAAVMAILQWFSTKIFHLDLSIGTIAIVGIVVLAIYCLISLNDIQIAGTVQTWMLAGAIIGCILTSVFLIFSGHWSFSNFTPFFQSSLGDGEFGGWCIGLALIITPYFGFETVPQMVEEGDFPIKDSTKAIWGSVVTCGVIYTLLFFAIAGIDTYENILFIGGDAANGEIDFLTISMMERILGWHIWPVIYGIFGILCAIGTCLLGFWLSTVRLLYSMGRAGFLPKAFAKVNKHQQPILPNLFLLGISIIFLITQNTTSFMKDFFNLMAFGCGLTYTITTIGSFLIHKKHPNWKSTFKMPGGEFMRVLAVIISVAIAFGTTIGQGIGSWICFGIYVGIGVILWITMLFKWRTEKVKIMTPDGEIEF